MDTLVPGISLDALKEIIGCGAIGGLCVLLVGLFVMKDRQLARCRESISELMKNWLKSSEEKQAHWEAEVRRLTGDKTDA